MNVWALSFSGMLQRRSPCKSSKWGPVGSRAWPCFSHLRKGTWGTKGWRPNRESWSHSEAAQSPFSIYPGGAPSFRRKLATQKLSSMCSSVAATRTIWPLPRMTELLECGMLTGWSWSVWMTRLRTRRRVRRWRRLFMESAGIPLLLSWLLLLLMATAWSMMLLRASCSVIVLRGKIRPRLE